MVLYFSNESLKKSIENDAERKNRFGVDMAEKIKLRMEGLQAAMNLADFLPPYSGPECCHELNGVFKGIFSIDLKNPYRLLFKPTENQQKETYNLQDWEKINEVTIVGIEDTNV
jgi:proteic killer suppression protein